jgi:hypothetical protein
MVDVIYSLCVSTLQVVSIAVTVLPLTQALVALAVWKMDLAPLVMVDAILWLLAATQAPSLAPAARVRLATWVLATPLFRVEVVSMSTNVSLITAAVIRWSPVPTLLARASCAVTVPLVTLAMVILAAPKLITVLQTMVVATL